MRAQRAARGSCSPLPGGRDAWVGEGLGVRVRAVGIPGGRRRPLPLRERVGVRGPAGRPGGSEVGWGLPHQLSEKHREQIHI